jgi:23S rRNA (adenine1618-N6)-methyltransferase
LCFARRIVAQSADRPATCLWFTTLVSTSARLPRLHQALKHASAADVRIIDMAQGQKTSRILAWTFLVRDEQRARLAKS